MADTPRRSPPAAARKKPRRVTRKPVPRVAVANQQKHVRFAATLVRRVVTAVLRSRGVTRAEISVALVDDAAIWELNRQFLGHDYPTDVISFRLDDELDFSPPLPTRRGTRSSGKPDGGTTSRSDLRAAAGAEPAALTGEVVASGEMAVRRATEFGWSPERELALYLVHGVLHLCGLDDQTTAQRREMRSAEAQVFGALGWKLPQVKSP